MDEGAIKKLVFIVNLKAGTGDRNNIVEVLEKFAGKQTCTTKILYTGAPKHAVHLAVEAVKDHVNMVVAVGGDGTVNEVAGSLKNSDCTLAIIPTGSGNGLARHFGIPLYPERALETIFSGTEKKIDTLLVNEHFSVNISGIGFDAQVAKLFASHGKRGFLTYAKISLREYIKFHPIAYTLILPQETIRGEAFIIVFANGTQWGNNAKIAPSASADDGLITLGILKKLNIYQIPSFISKLFSGKLDRFNHMKYYQVPSLKLTSRFPVPLHIDGEAMEMTNEIFVMTEPASLKIIVPSI